MAYGKIAKPPMGREGLVWRQASTLSLARRRQVINATKPGKHATSSIVPVSLLPNPTLLWDRERHESGVPLPFNPAHSFPPESAFRAAGPHSQSGIPPVMRFAVSALSDQDRSIR